MSCEVFCLFRCKICHNDVVVKGALSRNCLHSDLQLIARPLFFTPLNGRTNAQWEAEKARMEAQMVAQGVPGWSQMMRPGVVPQPRAPNQSWRPPTPRPRMGETFFKPPEVVTGQSGETLLRPPQVPSQTSGGTVHQTVGDSPSIKRSRKVPDLHRIGENPQQGSLPPFSDLAMETSTSDLPTTIHEDGESSKAKQPASEDPKSDIQLDEFNKLLSTYTQ